MKEVAFVIDMTPESEIGTSLQAFKYLTTRFRPVKGYGSDRRNPSRRA